MATFGRLLSGVDGIFWHQPVSPAGPGIGRVDQTAYAYVLLETVALAAHEGQELSGVGREPEVGN